MKITILAKRIMVVLVLLCLVAPVLGGCQDSTRDKKQAHKAGLDGADESDKASMGM